MRSARRHGVQALIRRLPFALPLFAFLTAACPSTSGPDAGEDAGGDAGTDGGGESVPDAGVDGGTSQDAGTTLMLRLFGSAEGEAVGADGGSDSAECELVIDVIDVVAEGDGWNGTAVGEVFRTVYEDEARYEFSAFVAGPASLIPQGDGSGHLSVVGDQPDDASPFWLAIETLVATPDAAPHSWSGTWSCAPLGLDEPGFRDSTLTVPGTFTVQTP